MFPDTVKYFVIKEQEILIFIVLLVISEVCTATTCYKNEAIGNRTGNVYYCNDESTPECCTEGEDFSCCEAQSDKTLREQLILWGSLAGFVLVLALVLCYLWKDIHCCKDDIPLKEKCCRCCKKKEDEVDLTPIPEPSGSRSYSFGQRSGTLENLYRDTPIPTFNYKPKY